MNLKELDFRPDGEWKWSFYGFLIVGAVGSALHQVPILGIMLGGLIGSLVGWLLNFYDKNFS